MFKSFFSILLAGCVLCCATSASAQDAGLRFVHASPHYDAVDFYLNENLNLFEAVEAFHSSGVRTEFPALEYQTSVKAAGASDPVIASGSVTTMGSSITTVALLGEPGNVKLLPMSWDMETPPQGSIRIRLVHASSLAEGAVDVFLDNTKFLENISQYEASGFTEVPIEQSEQIEVRDRDGLLVGKFNGQFDPGNSYSLFFSTRDGQPTMHVLFENSLDPQLPLTEAESLGSLVPMRVANVMQDVTTSFWSIGGQQLPEEVAQISASRANNYILSEGNSTIAVSSEDGGTPIDEFEVAIPADNPFVFFAVGAKGQEKIVEGPMPIDPPVSGSMAVRFLNALPNGAVNVVLNSEFGIQPNLAKNSLSGYTELEAQVATFSVFSSATQDLIAEGRLSLESGRTYTVIIVDPDAGPQIRVLDESRAAEQSPLLTADEVISGFGMFRAINMIGGDRVLTFQNEDNSINYGMGSNSSSVLVRNLPEGKQEINVFSDMDPDNPAASDSVNMRNEVATLCVAYGPDEENVQIAWTDASAERGDPGTINIRVFSALEGEEPFSLWSSVANRNVINGISYGEFSNLTNIEYDPAIEFSLRRGGTQLHNFKFLEDYRRTMTLFVTMFEGNIAVFVLKEDEEGPQDPMILTENIAIESVEELHNTYGFSAKLQSEVVSENLTLQFESKVPVVVDTEIVSVSGRKMPQHAFTTSVGTQSIQTMQVSTLPPGMYIAKVTVGGIAVGIPFLKE